MKLMFPEEHLVNHKGIFYVLDGTTRMKRMKDMKIIYHGYLPPILIPINLI